MANPGNTTRPRSVSGGASVPFISKWQGTRAFSDLGEHCGVTNVERMLDGWGQTRQKALRDTRFEAQVGDWNTVPSGLLELLAKYRRAVARIVVPGGQVDFQGLRNDSGWTGTGFLVAPNLLLTNHHVLNSVAVAGAAVAEFDYEWPTDKLFANVGTTEPPAVRFDLSPSRLFVTSPVSGDGLDYSFVWISEQASEQFGTIRLERGSFMISQFEPTFIIHHPRGRLKEVSLDDTELLAVNSLNILYAADTDFGSSGASVFNRNGRLVALHHARQSGETLRQLYPDVAQTLSDGRPVTVGNEGIKISAIALDLESRMRQGGKDAESAAEILETIEGSDTLTGIFGALGRRSVSESDAQRVRDIYQSSDQDIDVGFWNMHWLLDSQGGPSQVEDAVTAMADLNLDLWCLTDVPPSAKDEIVNGLAERFGETFSSHFCEPDALIRRVATAVIWRPNTVNCTPAVWPSAVARAWPQVAPDPQAGGGVFSAPPGLFEISRTGGDGGRLANLVPISLRSIRDDERLRRLASKLLVRAVDLVIEQQGNTADWMVGGNYEPPLAHEDSVALQFRDYEVMAAADTGRGSAISYLRSPSSGVRKVFVTGDLGLVDNKREFFDVVKSRTVDKYIRKLADNRPAVMRLSLDTRDSKASEARLDDLVASMLAGNGSSVPTKRPAHPVADSWTTLHAEGSKWSAGLVWQGLDKPGFLQANRARFRRLLALIAEDMRPQFPDLSPLTETDLWVITFAEAGLDLGRVNPDFRHSLGEIGLYPLPGNIRFWIGDGAPDWDRPMPLETNIEAYVRYLAQIRNKAVATVSELTLYRDLFRRAGIAGAPERQARLLAGVVHGYFVKANYRGRPVPLDHILEGFAADRPVDAILAGTGYVHDGTSILENRQRNVDDAIAALRVAGPA